MITRKMHIILPAELTHEHAEALRRFADAIDFNASGAVFPSDMSIAYDDGTVYVMEDGPRKALTYTLPDGRTVTERPLSFPEEDEGGE